MTYKAVFITLALTFVFTGVLCSGDTFKWGTATAAFQIEGALDVDGRLPSIWDVFSEIPNNIYKNQTAAVADDSYHRFRQDIQLMKDINLKHYRLSLSWPRIVPDGVNVNPAGISYYRTVLEALLEAGIEPLVTLYHWDLPQAVYVATNGGWTNASVVDYYMLYARTVFDAYHDIVKHWITFNEPWTQCVWGYDEGQHAPGHKDDAYKCAHHMLISHAGAVKYFREQNYDSDVEQGQVAITLNVEYGVPASESEADRAAAERYLVWQLAWFADPIYFGDYPQIMKDYIGDRLPAFTDEQKADLKGSHDFFGLNHYSSYWIRDVANGTVNNTVGNWHADQLTDGDGNGINQYNGTLIGKVAASEWLFDVPWGLYKMIKWIDERYDTPTIYITENGCDAPDEDVLPLEDIVNDTYRIDYLSGYITEMTRAKHTGSDVRGYFIWSLMDNFEWAAGYSVRFGLHYVNYTQNVTRYQKNSAVWLQDYMDRNPDARYIAGGDNDDDDSGLSTLAIVLIVFACCAVVMVAVLFMYRFVDLGRKSTAVNSPLMGN